MPRRKRADGAAAKVRLLSLSAHLDDNSMDDGALDGDLEDYGSPVGTGSPHQPLQRNAANARERARMRVLSRAFCRLKTTLPWVPADTKLSKLDTLRLATSYIAHLRDVLLLPEGEAPASAHTHSPASNPLNLTWPFTFPQPGGPGVPLVGPEPWISRGAAAASSRCGQSSRGPATPSGADKHTTARGDGSGGSSNASSSSSGADDDPGLRDDEEHEESEEQAQCRRGLSGGRLVDLQQQLQQQQLPQLPQLPQHCHSYQPQADYHPYLQRYVDSSMPL